LGGLRHLERRLRLGAISRNAPGWNWKPVEAPLVFEIEPLLRLRQHPDMIEQTRTSHRLAERVVSRREALQLTATITATMIVGRNRRGAESSRKFVVWSEGRANVDPAPKKVYPDDINTAIAEGLAPLKSENWQVIKASLNDPEQGISDDLLKST